MYLLLTIVAVLVIWSLWGLASSRVEQTSYTVVRSTSDYEVRKYPAHLVAQTTVQGTYESALNEGFRIIAAYIFGANVKKEHIAMTAPVVEQKRVSEKIAMTAPVVASLEEGEEHTIRFGMPRAYTQDSLPVPSDPRVKIVALPERTMAVLRFSWFRSPRHVELKKKQLIDALARDHTAFVGEVYYAGYNAPWTPPWMARNEVWVELAGA